MTNGCACRPALPDGRSSASHDPSARVSMGRGFMHIARHSRFRFRSAPAATARDHNGNPQNPRSANNNIPGSSRSISSAASVVSAVV